MRKFQVFVLIGLILQVYTLSPNSDILIYPNTENSPSLFLIKFTLAKALPSNSYLLVAMDWYTSAVTPLNCYLVNTTISTPCTNFAAPIFPLTITTANFVSFNSILNTSKVVVVQVTSNLLPSTVYALQV
jgi:hypothetical protein